MLWKLLPKKSEDLITQLLLNRGIKTEEEIKKFSHPSISNYEREIDIPGIEKAQKRIKKAIKNEELIIIYGDYDVDGLCATTILYKAITSLGGKVLPYIPHREKEGYGLSKIGLDWCKEVGADLVITVDNGIVALEQAKYAKKISIDLIITDHHLPLNKKPEALAVVHSIKMCGAAVAWCTVRSMVKHELALELLQFVAIATITDLIALLGLGRAFVYEGLKVLNRTTSVGLLALMNETNIKMGQVGTYEIGFILGPRLNAIGRLEHAMDALRLLCTKDPKKARTLATLLSETNAKRQKLTDEAVLAAKLRIDNSKKIHILDSREWSAGVIGLVAARICEQSLRPAIVISLGETFSKGSARSVDGINIIEIIRQCSDLLLDVGGHPGAAGFTILNENIEQFKLKLEKIALNFPDEMDKTLEIEAELDSKKLTKKLAQEISLFSPFGLNNPQPLLLSRRMIISDIRTVGEGKHLKFKIDDIDAIAFGKGELINTLRSGQLVNIVYNLEIDRFNGFEKVQLKVKDIKLN